MQIDTPTIIGTAQGTASFASSASFSTSASQATTASFSQTASYVAPARYVQVLSPKVTGVSATNTNIVSGSITAGGRPLQVIITGDANPTSGTAFVQLTIYRTTSNPPTVTTVGNIVQAESSSGNENVPFCVQYIDGPSTYNPANTITFFLRTVSMSGTWEFGESAGPTLTIVEL